MYVRTKFMYVSQYIHDVATVLDVDQERRNLGSHVMTENEELITSLNDVDSTQKERVYNAFQEGNL